MSETPNAGAARADYCRLLSACFYQPDPMFREERMFEALTAAGRSLGQAYEADALAMHRTFVEADLQSLLVDYTHLFIGPADRRASPYESSWLGRDGASPETPILALYAEGDFDVADDFLNLPDHVAAQLEFLYLSLFRQAEAEAAGDLDAIARWEALERRLLRDHLGAWVSPFAAAIRSGAETAFYRTLADAVERFMQDRAREYDAR